MELTEQVKKDINRAINRIAEGYREEDEKMPWQTCIEHAIDDFSYRLKEIVHDFEYENVTQEDLDMFESYAINNVNWKTIKEYA